MHRIGKVIARGKAQKNRPKAQVVWKGLDKSNLLSCGKTTPKNSIGDCLNKKIIMYEHNKKNQWRT